MTKGTFVNITKADGQTTHDIVKRLDTIGIGTELVTIENNEILINVPDSGLGLALNNVKIAVLPATARMFDRYIEDSLEVRTYY